jgi:RNA polymerase sigma-70 factor (ECF subfamily)
MFIVDSWNSLLRFVFWMAPTRPPKGPSGSGSGSGNGGNDDPEDFETIFKRYFGEVLQFFLRKGIRRETAQDLTQETFLRVYQGIREFRNESSLRTWIFSIAENVWRNAARHQNAGKRKGSEISFSATADDAPEIPEGKRFEGWGQSQETLDAILEEERKEKLYKALGGLPARMRECILARVHEDLKYREIADLMGIDIGTVKAQIYQAKERLKKELGPYFDSFDLGDDDDGE